MDSIEVDNLENTISENTPAVEAAPSEVDETVEEGCKRWGNRCLLENKIIAAPAEPEVETTVEDMDNDAQLYENLTYTQRMDLFVKVCLSFLAISDGTCLFP